MPRPKKKSSEKLSSCLPAARCTDEEKSVIQNRAGQAGMSLSEYIRHSALKGRVITKESDLDFEAINQLRRIGVNLNQQTRRLNATGNLPYQLISVWQRLETALNNLIEKS